MGRHSAPDDDEDEVDVEAVADVADIADVAAEPTPNAPATRVGRGTNADLRLLRENRALRARCAAAVVVPFLLYTAVLLVIGRAGVYLLWLWIPTVTAGVLAGVFLDRAARAESSPPAEPPVAPTSG